MNVYLPIILKLGIGLIALIVQINIFGKGNLAPSNALDQVQNYVLGGIIGGTIYSETITVFQFIIVLIIWTLLVMILKFLKEHNHLAKKIIDGTPSIVIERGKVNVDAVVMAGQSASDLMFKLREQEVYDISQVKRAVLEQNGQLTVIEYGDQNPKYPIIYDGQANLDVLDAIDQDEDWLNQQVIEAGYSGVYDIFIGEYIQGKVRLTPYQQSQTKK
ncbi:transmembrane protein [Fructobacillus pseudoficulneus]|uniref:Transmembrane protein n=1 Tax=Fructobacillus pseudoficulneus TaxID=220714 RepID=A0A3F3GUX6_9LACO|nr:DUF421 domain-containing protein [Fructobacillus pseudoficulneus]GAP03145.1 transmembrane protein [Fructobacillus pseudoficulneus]SEH41074.1 Uncharacterized membrane protein YcaP, DUF421 family [Fructobacillus pseudoficulneus]